MTRTTFCFFSGRSTKPPKIRCFFFLGNSALDDHGSVRMNFCFHIFKQDHYLEKSIFSELNDKLLIDQSGARSCGLIGWRHSPERPRCHVKSAWLLPEEKNRWCRASCECECPKKAFKKVSSPKTQSSETRKALDPISLSCHILPPAPIE